MSLRSIVITAVVTAAIASVPSPVGSQQSPTPFGTTVEVSRILTEVRVVTFDGEPVLGLEPEDFRVKVDGQPAEVRSVLWIPSTSDAAASSEAPDAVDGPSPVAEGSVEGRTIVILFQIDFGLRVSRTEGLLRMSPRAAEFVQNLGPDDRVALLSFGSHLRLHSDFTSDHVAMAEMLGTLNILEAGGEPPAPATPLLADHLDPEAAKKAADLSTALELIGQALREFPGAKSLVLFGYGLGSMSAGWRVTIDDGYNRAMTALTQSRTSVFSLDLTDADYHSLEVGLRAVSEDTGGFFVRTHIFPDLAIDRLASVISSYYELEIIPPPELKDDFIIKVKVNRPRVDVYVRQYHPSHYGW
jgi:VWFA-related protein